MTTEDFTAELYRDFNWRWDELRRLTNLLTFEQDEAARDDLRKSVVVVLYSHFEGFCVFALEHYLVAINKAGIDCAVAEPSILAGAWEKVFNAMEHGDEKCKVFLHQLPMDEGLHRHWRRRHFVEEINRFFARPVQIAEDVIDTESNLKPQVLQRNLFLLGLDHKFVDPYAATIQNLLGRRNRLAHGEDRRGVPKKEFDDYESAAFTICYRLIEFLEDAHRNERYRRPDPEYRL